MKAQPACIAVAVLAVSLPMSAQTADRRADAAAIAKFTTAYESAYNSHDSKAAAAFYAADGSRRTADGRVVSGRDAVARQLAEDFAGRFKSATVKFEAAADVRCVGTTMAIVDGAAQLSGVTSGMGRPAAPARYFHTMLLVKRDGGWLILALRNWPAPAPSR